MWPSGKDDGENTASAGSVADPDRASVGFYNFIGNGQPEPEVPFGASGFFGPEKTVKNFPLILIGNADSVIPDWEQETLLFIGKKKLNLPVLRRIADRIVQEDGEYLADAVRIGQAQRERSLRQADRQGDGLFLCKRLESFKDIHEQSVQLGWLWWDGKKPVVGLGESEQVVDERGHALSFLLDNRKKSLFLLVGGIPAALGTG